MRRHKSIPIFFAAAFGLFVVLALLWSTSMNLFTGLFLAMANTLALAMPGWFILSLVLYLRGKKRGDDDLPTLKVHLAVASAFLVLSAVTFALLVGFFALALTHM